MYTSISVRQRGRKLRDNAVYTHSKACALSFSKIGELLSVLQQHSQLLQLTAFDTRPPEFLSAI